MRSFFIVSFFWLLIKWIGIFIRSGWNSPMTAVSGSPISASDYNTYTRDNLIYLASQRPIELTSYIGSAITSTSTAWVAVSASNARITKTIYNGRVRGSFTVHCQVSFSVAGVAYMYFTVYRDAATNLGNTTYGICVSASQSGRQTITIPFHDTGLTVGQHDWDLMWKVIVVSGSGVTMNIESASATGGAPIVGQLIEV